MIREAAIELFAKQGFQATPTAKVAQLAGVSEGTVFYHFQTKEGILVSLFEEIVQQFIGNMRQVLDQAPSGLAAVLDCLRVQADLFAQRPRESLILVRDMPASITEPGSPHRDLVMGAMSQLIDLITQAVTKGQKDGSIRPCDPRRGAYMVLGMITGMGRLRLLGMTSEEDLDQEVLEFCQRALATTHGPNLGQEQATP